MNDWLLFCWWILNHLSLVWTNIIWNHLFLKNCLKKPLHLFLLYLLRKATFFSFPKICVLLRVQCFDATNVKKGYKMDMKLKFHRVIGWYTINSCTMWGWMARTPLTHPSRRALPNSTSDSLLSINNIVN